MASGDAAEAFAYADRRGMIREASTDDALFARAAEHFVANRVKGIETLAVIPFWDEIERFNAQVRPALRTAGLLGEVEVVREAVKPLTWTDEQKAHWDQYRVGDRLVFARHTRFFKRGSAAEVVAILHDGLLVRGASSRETKLTRRQRAAFDVGRVQTLAVAAGDRLLIRGQSEEAGLANGDFKDVALVDPAANRIVFTDGHELPPDFAAWTYGHAITSYRSQGSTSEESLLVLGEVAARALTRQQFYVGNTRYRGAHAIYVANKEAIHSRLQGFHDPRELATEFVQRHRMAELLHVVPRVLQQLRERARRAWFMRNARRVHERQQADANLRT